MTDLPISLTSTAKLSWDGEGRRVSGGPLAPDVTLPEGEDGLSFSDLLSVFNPLQHIPVVSSLYRWVTGDTIKPAARVIGGALFGGPIGMASAAFNAIIEQAKGADIGAQVLAMFDGGKTPPDAADPKLAAAVASGPETPERGSGPETGISTGADALAQLAADLRGAREQPAKSDPPAGAMPQSAAPSGPGRTLAYYQANAGHRLPAADLSKGRIIQAQPVPPAIHTPPTAVAAQLAGQVDKASDPGSPQEEPPAQWFNAAMMRGLDRYRAMQRGDAAPQVDLSH